jgi:hypothetical protein
MLNLGASRPRRRWPKPKPSLPRTRQPCTPRPSHDGEAQYRRAQCRIRRRLTAAAMIQARLSRIAEATRAMIRSRPATSSVTAVQAHPSRSTRTSEDNALNPAVLVNPFEHRSVRSHFTFPIVETTRYVATLHKAAFAAHASGRDLFGNELFRPRERSEGRTDRRTQHSPHPPEGGREHVFEPIGRSQTTSPMGFVAFRRNQRR